jgi:hypothetical protein
MEKKPQVNVKKEMITAGILIGVGLLLCTIIAFLAQLLPSN